MLSSSPPCISGALWQGDQPVRLSPAAAPGPRPRGCQRCPAGSAGAPGCPRGAFVPSGSWAAPAGNPQVRRRAAPGQGQRALQGRDRGCGSGVAAPGQPAPRSAEAGAAPLSPLHSAPVPSLHPPATCGGCRCCRRPSCPAPSPPLSRCHPGPAAAPSPLMSAGEAGAPRRCCRFRARRGRGAAAAGSGAGGRGETAPGPPSPGPRPPGAPAGNKIAFWDIRVFLFLLPQACFKLSVKIDTRQGAKAPATSLPSPLEGVHAPQVRGWGCSGCWASLTDVWFGNKFCFNVFRQY